MAGHRTRLRAAQSYEFSIYLTDGGTLCLPDGDHAIHPGFCRFVPPGTKLCSIPHYKAYTVYFSLLPETEGRFPHCRNPFLDAIPLHWQSRMPEAYPPLLEKLTEALFQTEVGAALQIRQLMLSLLLLIHRDTTQATPATLSRQAVNTVRDHLEQNLSRDISLDELGTLTGYHPLYLQRLFKQLTGHTPHEQLTLLRLQRARELLVTTDQPVSRIALSCGYSSVSHFNALFKRHLGTTPLLYRKAGKILP
jgi:AraC-like DNA-binding protein